MRKEREGEGWEGKRGERGGGKEGESATKNKKERILQRLSMVRGKIIRKIGLRNMQRTNRPICRVGVVSSLMCGTDKT